MRRNALWIVTLHSVLLAMATLALALGLPVGVAIAALVVSFGAATTLLVAKLEGSTTATEPPRKTSPAPAEALNLQPLLDRLAALKQGNLAARTQPVAGPLQSLNQALDEATREFQRLVRQSLQASKTLARAGNEIEKSNVAVASAAERQISAMAEISRRLQVLASRCEEVSQLVEVLDDLARQTNVLALNAALEASRAGPSGKGFAMVADEVRKLAERSAAATKDVGAFIQTLEGGTSDAGRMLDEVQGLARSLAEGAASTAEVSQQLVSASQELAAELGRLEVEDDDDHLKRALLAKRAEMVAVLEEISPRFEDAQSPLGRALHLIHTALAGGEAKVPHAQQPPAAP